jgi:hypothetical protein
MLAMNREPLVFAFHADTLYTFEPAVRGSASRFGGPPPAQIYGQPFGPRPLHLITSLGARHIPALGECYFGALPLIYGMYYDGCMLSYHVEISHKVKLLHIQPQRLPTTGRMKIFDRSYRSASTTRRGLLATARLRTDFPTCRRSNLQSWWSPCRRRLPLAFRSGIAVTEMA